MPPTKITAPREEIIEALAYLAATSRHVSILIERNPAGLRVLSDTNPEFVGAETSWRLAIATAEKFFQPNCVAKDAKPPKKRLAVHLIVLSAFKGAKPFPKAEANHRNGKKRDNRASNLEWVTHQENGLHASASGLLRPPRLNGEKNGRAKLTARQVKEIRKAKGHIGARVLANGFGVSRSAIQFIHQNKHWL